MIDKDSHAQLTSLRETLGIELLLRTLIDVVEEGAVPPTDETVDLDPEGERCYFAVGPLQDIVRGMEPIRP